MLAGAPDIARAVDALAARLPEALRPLAEAAYDLAWCWDADGPATYAAVDRDRWARCGESPVRLLQEVDPAALAALAADPAFVERASALRDRLAAARQRPAADAPRVAYFCAEFGVHASIPIYSGGLGALAGDIVKEAADLALPFVGVGLLYREGYFRQRIDPTGWQTESWIDTDPGRLPAVLVHGEDGEPLTVDVPIRSERLRAQVWRVDVGAVPLFLLDADRPENPSYLRFTSARLYTGDPDVRLAQYALLGIGGARALAALGIEPEVVHLNEGHAAFAALELARPRVKAGIDLTEAVAETRERVVFTTHTPVPAGNDTYPAGQVAAVLEGLAGEMHVDPWELVRLGRTDPADAGEPFGVTQLALRASRAANGVSARHGEVAREMWQPLWPETAVEAVPIGHVTNGVHVPTWIGPRMRAVLGDDVLAVPHDPERWRAAVDAASDEELWEARRAQRAALIAWVRERSVALRLGRGEPRYEAEAAARALDPDALTIGFARRVATYKRLDLLYRDVDRVRHLLGGDRPVQLLVAGKAHPRDDEGKHLLQRFFGLRGDPAFQARVVFLDDYDLSVAGRLVRGCDVWMNLPRPPLEASGTSGMKSAVNGGLHLSVLDGWWAEAYDGANGFGLPGDVLHDVGAQDHRDGEELLRVLEQEVVPAFYDRDASGRPARWLELMRGSLKTNGPRFAAGRMLGEYVERYWRAA